MVRPLDPLDSSLLGGDRRVDEDACSAFYERGWKAGYRTARGEDADTELLEDGRKWRAAEAEGHVVTFREDGYGLMHPPSCRPDLIGCMFNEWLATQLGPDREPGRYRMLWPASQTEPKYAPLDPA